MEDPLFSRGHEPPALPAAPVRPHFGEFEYAGERFYHDSRGNQIGHEVDHQTPDGRKTIFHAADSFGESIEHPAHVLGFVLEGDDGISGLTSRIVERDDLGRPKKTIAYQTHRGIAGSMADAIISGATGEQPDEWLPGGYEEIIFGYEPHTGLLSTITEIEESDGHISKTIHRNVFDGEGRRTGYIKSEWVDIDSSNGQELYDVTELRIFRRNEEGNKEREIVYIGYEESLVPWMVKEYTVTGSRRVEDITFLRPYTRRDQWPYKISQEPRQTTLVEQKGMRDGDRTTAMPSWIPKAAAYYLASQAISPEEAAELPYFAETKGTIVTDHETALRQMYATYSPDEISQFVNDVCDKKVVVLSGRPGVELARELMVRSARGQLTDIQKVGIIAMTHEAFTREDVVPSSLLEEVNDREYLDMFLEWMNTDLHSVTETLDMIGTSLSDGARRCQTAHVAVLNICCMNVRSVRMFKWRASIFCKIETVVGLYGRMGSNPICPNLTKATKNSTYLRCYFRCCPLWLGTAEGFQTFQTEILEASYARN